MFTNHPSLETIADLVEGKLMNEANATALNHLSNCAECAKTASDLQAVVGYMRSDKMEDAPSYVLSNAFNIMPRKVKVETPSLLQKIVAAISFDSLSFTPAYGVRSGATSQSRQIIFNAGERDIDVRITKQGEQFVVAGQILGECSKGRVVLKGEGNRVESELNDLCEFRLPPVKDGNYQLILVFTDLEIELPEFVVK